MPIRFLINQCQIITFLILKYDIIENSRIELRGIVLPVQMGGLWGGGGGGGGQRVPTKMIEATTDLCCCRNFLFGLSASALGLYTCIKT